MIPDRCLADRAHASASSSLGRPGRGLWLCLAGLLTLTTIHAVSGCATTDGQPAEPRELLQQELVLESLKVRVTYWPEDEKTVTKVIASLGQAVPATALWGEFEASIDLHILPDHESLARATKRYGYPWLRAWARYDEILLQSPRTFDLFERGAANLTELMVHELTHCLMYQRAASKENWRQADRTIPIWFREGMASFTAEQGHRRLSEAHLAEWRIDTGTDPISEADRLYKDKPEVVYAAAHWAFTHLMERYGTGIAVIVLELIRNGSDFPEAFRKATGIPEHEFTEGFLSRLDRYDQTGR